MSERVEVGPVLFHRYLLQIEADIEQGVRLTPFPPTDGHIVQERIQACSRDIRIVLQIEVLGKEQVRRAKCGFVFREEMNDRIHARRTGSRFLFDIVIQVKEGMR